jgi:uncharacterized protein YjdB
MSTGEKLALIVGGAIAIGVAGYSVYNALKPKGISITRVAVLPSQSTLVVGESQGLTAIAYYSDGSSKDVTSAAYWNSSNPALVAIQFTGEIQALASGLVNIDVNYLGMTGLAVINVI